jgi:hypothetical protein
MVALPPMGEDPPWPNLLVEESPFWKETKSFWGSRPGGAQWHRLVPTEAFDIFTGWQSTDWAKARDWIQKECHIDLLSRSVLLGSCHLILPNPVFSRSSVRVTDDWKAIVFDLTPFPGQRVTELELIVWNRRAWGATSITRQLVASNRTVIQLPEGVEETAHAIICPKRGVLKKTTETAFVAAVQIDLNLIAEHRQIKLQSSSKNRGPEEYSVAVSSPSRKIVAGTPRPRSATRRLIEDELRTRSRKAWDAAQVRWFDKDATGATQAIRDIVGAAQKGVDFLDPYFGAMDLFRFAPATSIRDLPVRILTAADFCSTRVSPNRVENGQLLMDALASLRSQIPHLQLEIKVMLGEKSPVHDRFLIVDGTTWVLGASLDEFGQRGSLLLRLPDPPVKERSNEKELSIPVDVFVKIWSGGTKQVESLQDFIARRKAEHQVESLTSRLARTLHCCRKAYDRMGEIWRA